MKKDIHPEIFEEVTVTCACGNSFVTQSTSQTLQVDICSACHPLYTGKQKLIDTEGRIDKFNKKLNVAQKAAEEKAKKQKSKVKEEAPAKPTTLKEMLRETKDIPSEE